jgi:hypothetical protein
MFSLATSLDLHERSQLHLRGEKDVLFLELTSDINFASAEEK